MQFMSRQTLKHLEATIQNSYSLPIFKGYKAINKTGVEKLIDELYANLPDDVKRAREYLHSRNYEMKSCKTGVEKRFWDGKERGFFKGPEICRLRVPAIYGPAYSAPHWHDD